MCNDDVVVPSNDTSQAVIIERHNIRARNQAFAPQRVINDAECASGTHANSFGRDFSEST